MIGYTEPPKKSVDQSLSEETRKKEKGDQLKIRIALRGGKYGGMKGKHEGRKVLTEKSGSNDG